MLSTLVQSEIRFISVEWIGFCDLNIVDASKAAKLQMKSYVWMQEKNQYNVCCSGSQPRAHEMHDQINTNRTGLQIKISALLKGSF